MNTREELKDLLIECIKTKDFGSRDVLRLVLADIEADYKKKDDEKLAQSVIRKHVKNNNEALAFYKEGDEGYNKLQYQTEVISAFLPKTLTIEAIRCSLEEVRGDIESANNDGQAVGVAMKHFKKSQYNVLGQDVKSVVEEIRNS